MLTRSSCWALRVFNTASLAFASAVRWLSINLILLLLRASICCPYWAVSLVLSDSNRSKVDAFQAKICYWRISRRKLHCKTCLFRAGPHVIHNGRLSVHPQVSFGSGLPWSGGETHRFVLVAIVWAQPGADWFGPPVPAPSRSACRPAIGLRRAQFASSRIFL